MRRFVGLALWVLSYAFAAFLGGGGVWLYDRVPSGAGDCVTNRRMVSANSAGNTVEAEEELCWGLANSATVTLSLVMHPGMPPRKFLAYAIGQSEPIMRWEGDDTLVVSLQGTQDILFKRYYSGAIKIRYE